MKKTFPLVLTFVLLLGACPVLFTSVEAASSQIYNIPLKYFDEETYTIKAGDGVPSPEGIATVSNSYGSNLEPDNRKTGVLGRASDDACLLLKTTSTSAAAEYAPTMIMQARGSSNAANINFAAGQKLLFCMDVAPGDVVAGATKLIQLGIYIDTGTGNSSSNKKYPKLVTFQQDGMKLAGKTEVIPYKDNNPNQWYNFIIELTAGSQNYSIWIDGVGYENLSMGVNAPFYGIYYLRAGGITTTAANTEAFLYNDNVACYLDEAYSPERYKVNKDAAALSFVRHMRSGGEIDGTDTIDSVTSNLTLPSSIPGGEGSVITWSSSDPSVITDTGVVNRQSVDKNVKLTATITNGNKTSIKEFDLVVRAYDATPEEIAAAKAKLQTIIDANISKTSDQYTPSSFAPFSDALTNAQNIAANPSASLTEILTAAQTLTDKINALVEEEIITSGTVTKDTYFQANGSTNYGLIGTLYAKFPVTETSGTTRRRAYIAFDVSNIAKDATKVLLRLYAVDSTAATTDVYIHPASTSWDETTLLAWADIPAVNASYIARATPGVATTADPSTHKYVDFDVTDYVVAQRNLATPATELAFAVATNSSGSAGFQFASREYAEGDPAQAYPPQLVATTAKTIGSKMQEDLDSININDYINDVDADSITQSLKPLPATGKNGYTITWKSSNPSVMSDEGVVVMPAETTPVTMTATINSDGVTHTRDFHFTVRVFTTVEADCNALTFDIIRNNNVSEDAIFQSLNLPAVGSSGNTTITWTSTNTDVISDTGLVTLRTGEVNDVTLIATVSDGSYSIEKEFNLTVYGEKQYFADDCNDFSKVYAKSSKLAIHDELGYKAIIVTTNNTSGEYITYKAKAGSFFEVREIMSTNASYSGTGEVTFATSADGVNFTEFTPVTKGESKIDKDYTGTALCYLDYTSNQPLPAGTGYLRINIPSAPRAWARNIDYVKLYNPNVVDYVASGDIKGKNDNLNEVGSDLSLVSECNDGIGTVTWESDNVAIVGNDGKVVARPQEATPVNLTATITRDGKVAAKKVFKLTVLPYQTDLEFGRPWSSKGYRINKDDPTMVFAKGDTVTAKVEVRNMTDSEQTATIILAVYNSAGILVDFGKAEITVGNQTSETQLKSADFTLKSDGSYSKAKVRVFVWDFEKMAPLSVSDSVVLNK